MIHTKFTDRTKLVFPSYSETIQYGKTIFTCEFVNGFLHITPESESHLLISSNVYQKWCAKFHRQYCTIVAITNELIPTEEITISILNHLGLYDEMQMHYYKMRLDKNYDMVMRNLKVID